MRTPVCYILALIYFENNLDFVFGFLYDINTESYVLIPGFCEMHVRVKGPDGIGRENAQPADSFHQRSAGGRAVIRLL